MHQSMWGFNGFSQILDRRPKSHGLRVGWGLYPGSPSAGGEVGDNFIFLVGFVQKHVGNAYVPLQMTRFNIADAVQQPAFQGHSLFHAGNIFHSKKNKNGKSKAHYKQSGNGRQKFAFDGHIPKKGHKQLQLLNFILHAV